VTSSCEVPHELQVADVGRFVARKSGSFSDAYFDAFLRVETRDEPSKSGLHY